jgi:hypothetical protein
MENIMRSIKHVRFKKILSIALIVIGAIIILTGIYAKFRVSLIKSDINKRSNSFFNNPVDKQIDTALVKKVGEYDVPILFTLIGGAVVTILGIGTLIYSRKGKKFR